MSISQTAIWFTTKRSPCIQGITKLATRLTFRTRNYSTTLCSPPLYPTLPHSANYSSLDFSKAYPLIDDAMQRERKLLTSVLQLPGEPVVGTGHQLSDKLKPQLEMSVAPRSYGFEMRSGWAEQSSALVQAPFTRSPTNVSHGSAPTRLVSGDGQAPWRRQSKVSNPPRAQLWNTWFVYLYTSLISSLYKCITNQNETVMTSIDPLSLPYFADNCHSNAGTRIARIPKIACA
ncbi:hypothetical protein BJ508DRAFT_100413 [Ascobolus immersus RN42]|uniref:Uncharacterized protein n=1 Tax=Ascobolus immersus RN42 TaxID=1160509 RepID=A0A3N4I7K7_ASCIM|nr:hypothetical protein BJ508DRAFT_100413 [Ascobolus immersus RN42]